MWEWDGDTGVWTDRTPKPLPGAWPSARYVGGFAYHPSRRSFALVGGGTPSGPVLDVWDWDGATGTWRDRTPTSSSAARPEVRSGFGMAVDDRRGTIWLFGGDAGAKGLLSDLWEWDGGLGVWVDRTQVAGPEGWPRARTAFGFAHDLLRHELVIVGGFVGYADTGYNPDRPFIREHWRLAL